jgi:hypothetical protein
MVEAVFIPVQVDEKKARAVFDRVSESHGIKFYSSMPDGTVVMSTAEGSANKARYMLMRDRIVLTYDQCPNSMNYYNGLISDFFDIYTAETGMSFFLAGNIIVRKLGTLDRGRDARDFLIKNTFSMKDSDLAPFKRPLHLAGARLFFPGFAEDPASFDVKIESSIEDHRVFFVENKALFPMPFNISADRSHVAKITARAEAFVEDNIAGFLAQYDREDVK